ncbi:helix-turn-helix domain-containing protein [Mycolicibacterium fortuitum]|uniref:helix-turn-helix domain-containing protein n=1 Tax=Mycolicibacterium fortuitum TaxID=1766 RepID=UPI002626E0ED|nr:helix-turn-helix domain-containing protein [Mycolicibacterium fortuitum]
MTTTFDPDRVHGGLGLARPRRTAPARNEPTPGAVRLSAEAAAKYLNTSVHTMISWRRRGQGPRWYKHMGRVAYDVADLDAFQAQRGAK